jgi:RsiW-degrading membrane proteinase PrsW (M82 family)
MRKKDDRALDWLVLAIVVALIGSYYPPTQGLAAVVFFIALIGFFRSRLPRRIPAGKIKLLSEVLGIVFGLVALTVAGGIYGTISNFMSQRAISVTAAPFYEEVLKAGGIYVLALRSSRLLKPRRTIAISGLLAGLVFGIGEGLSQPSIYRVITAPLHGIETMSFALGVRSLMTESGSRGFTNATAYIFVAILSHMTWNLFAPFLP